MKSLVWLASYPKSGNTWMRMLFAAYQKPADDPCFDLNEAFAMTMSESRLSDFQRIAGKQELLAQEIDPLRQQVQLDLSQRVRPPVLLKTHNARVQHRGYPLIRRELTLGAIYVVRNPLDIVDSVADHWGVDHDRAIEMMGDSGQTIGGPKQPFVTQHLESWSGHVTSWVDQRAFPVHVVCYEDLLARTEMTFRNILTFLGWDPDRQKIQRAIKETQFERLQQREQESGFRECSKKSTSGTFFRSGCADRYRDVLTPKQIARVTGDHAEVMQRFGYPTEDAATANHECAQR